MLTNRQKNDHWQKLVSSYIVLDCTAPHDQMMINLELLHMQHLEDQSMAPVH